MDIFAHTLWTTALAREANKIPKDKNKFHINILTLIKSNRKLKKME